MLDLADRPAVLRSDLDASVNFVTQTPGTPGLQEARYVRRADDYFIVYLSCQTGCRMACRFCHLTQTGQTDLVDVPVKGLLGQADQVLSHYDSLDQPARCVHFNLMARGEPLASQAILHGADMLVDGLSRRALARGLVARCKISTIMPAALGDRPLTDVFRRSQPDLYYSLYSADPAFRRRWLPKAMDPPVALAKLADWQDMTRKLPVLHWAYIAGENDTVADTHALCDLVERSGLICDVNIVRYNPFGPAQGAEPDMAVIERNAQIIAERLPVGRVKIVGRVGFDVKASCGMFVGERRRGPHARLQGGG